MNKILFSNKISDIKKAEEEEEEEKSKHIKWTV
jgi:hypothetical protein